jgi:hypothetical protein
VLDLVVGNPVCERAHLWRWIEVLMIVGDVGVNVDDGDFDGWRLDVCRASVTKSGGGGSEISERIVVEAVDVQQVVEDD